jgi:hypothetical protein
MKFRDQDLIFEPETAGSSYLGDPSEQNPLDEIQHLGLRAET